MTCTEGREPSGLEMACLSRVLGDVRRYVSRLNLMVDLRIYGMNALETHASHLDSLCESDANATNGYDVLADALIWSDETSDATPVDVIHALRQLRHYRTHVMLGNDTPNSDVWRYCQTLFPNWVGFFPGRRKPTPELLAEYRRGDVSSRWCLRQLESETNAT